MRSVLNNCAFKLIKALPLYRRYIHFDSSSSTHELGEYKGEANFSELQKSCDHAKTLDEKALSMLGPVDLDGMLQSACRLNNLEVASKIIRSFPEPSMDQLTLYITLLRNIGPSNVPPFIHPAISGIWSKAVATGDEIDSRFVRMLFNALSAFRGEQERFISQVISEPARKTFDCGVLSKFFKYCMITHDKELARAVWEWGQVIRNREFGTFSYFSTGFQHMQMNGATLKELMALWEQITEYGLEQREDLINTMCAALSIDINQQLQFIKMIISKPPCPDFEVGILGAFLMPCGKHKNVQLALNIWSWGLSVRERATGSAELCMLTFQYLGICGHSGNLDLVESVWKEAEQFKLTHSAMVRSAYVSALGSVGAFNKVIKYANQLGIASLDYYMLKSVLGILSEAGQCETAREILRTFQRSNPSVASMNHYSCVIYGLSDKGMFEQAISLVNEAESHGHRPAALTWLPILGACKKHKNMPIASRVFKEIQRIERNKHWLTVTFLKMIDVCKACGQIEFAAEIERERLSRRLIYPISERVNLKVEGARGKVAFFNGKCPSGLDHAISDKIDRELNEWIGLLERRGFSSGPIRNKNAEMLALAYSVAGLNVREIMMRMDAKLCDASHDACRVLSGVLGVHIYVTDQGASKDQQFTHCMKEGECSCIMRQSSN